MGGTMSQLDWVALSVALIAYNFVMNWAERWTDAIARMEYSGWRQALNSWYALPGWGWQPSLLVVGNLAASAIFLYWRNSFPVDERVHRDAILGLTVANVFVYHMWTPLLLWGPRYWWAAAICSFLILGTSTGVVALMGVENAWLPFGLYIAYPVFALFMTFSTTLFWWNRLYVERFMRRIQGKRAPTYGIMPPELAPVIGKHVPHAPRRPPRYVPNNYYY